MSRGYPATDARMQSSPARGVLASRTAGLSGLALAFALTHAFGCAGGLSCGEGTVREGDRCVVARGDASRADAGDADPTAFPDELTSLLLVPVGDVVTAAVPRPVPAGVPSYFSVLGYFDDRSNAPLANGVRFALSPADAPATVRTVDGLVAVTIPASYSAPVRLTATATTRSGDAVTASLTLRSVAPTRVALRAIAAVDHPDLGLEDVRSLDGGTVRSAFDRLGAASLPPALVPAAGAARVFALVLFDYPSTRPDGVPETLQGFSVLDPSQVTLTATGGTVSADGRVRATGPGEVTVEARSPLAPESAQARVRFVPPLPAAGLVAQMSPLSVRSERDAAIVWETPANSLTVAALDTGAFASRALPVYAVIPSTASRAGFNDRWFFFARHGSGSDAYLEPLPASELTVRALGDATASRFEPSTGAFAPVTPGVALYLLAARGFEYPLLVETSPPFVTPSTLRLDPNPLAVTVPPESAGCGSVRAFITLPGDTERPITDVEAIAVRRAPHFMNSDTTFDLGDGPTPMRSPLRVCVRPFFGTASRSAELEFRLLNGRAMLTVNATLAR